MKFASLKSILAAFAVGAGLLTLAPVAQAQLTFTLNEFTADRLSVTLNAGTLLTTNGARRTQELSLFDHDHSSNRSWINSTVVSATAGAAFGTASFEMARAVSGGRGDHMSFTWSADLAAAGDLTTSPTFVFEAVGLFNPDNVGAFALYWGSDDGRSNYTLQSVGSTSAVPEPGTYAAIAGAAALGLAFWRRHQSATSRAR